MKKEKKWALMRTEESVNLTIFQVQYDYYQNPRNGHTVKTTVLKGSDAVNVIALTPERKIILVRQFRFGIGDYTLEIPGGLMEIGETPQQGSARELREETGYVGENWTSLGVIQSNPVFMDCLIHHFLAENAVLKYPLHLDEAEDVSLETMTIQQVYEAIDSGKIQHPHTITAFYFAKKYLL